MIKFKCSSFFSKSNTFLILGVLISGGSNGGALQSVEIYDPATNTTCSLPQLPEGRYYHTQDGWLACGGPQGENAETTCIKWSSDSGTWTESHELNENRAGHVSWATADGVYLMGGLSSVRSTELLKEDGTVEAGFSLKYDTMYKK